MLELASVFLTGKMAGDRAFRADDHCAFNRNGEVFNKGAIFAGVAYDLALEDPPSGAGSRVDGTKRSVPDPDRTGRPRSNPGGENTHQVLLNSAASDLPALPAEAMEALRAICRARIAPLVHQDR
ncbi:hypothetical protein [Gemmobacter sp. 24YEA27]|uniref:hypothetical protein n=1 Tax=Gemmobacter sp. 24YEA27 TaxID=3040672 RepID=UPI0024B32D57|nr:hypothetical protein [Gemmobacter sp. 24YEA27]